jgi:acetyl esterase
VTLDPDVATFLDQVRDLIPVPPPLDDVSAVRAFVEGLGDASAANFLEGESEPVDQVADLAIPGPHAPIPIRVFRPEGEDLPIIVFFHGGVFVLGGLEMHEPVLRRLANAIPAVVVTVDYRLAPAHRFPAAVDDAFAAVEWVAAHAAEWGGDPRSLAVMGDSAGGALAALVAVRARDSGGPHLELQVLIYPMIDPELSSKSARIFAEGYLTTRAFLELGWHAYLDGQFGQRYSAPVVECDLSGLPATIGITAECDPLRDEAEDYFQRLVDAGAPVIAHRYPGQIHGFLFMPAVIPQANHAIADLVEMVRHQLGPLKND